MTGIALGFSVPTGAGALISVLSFGLNPNDPPEVVDSVECACGVCVYAGVELMEIGLRADKTTSGADL